MVPWKATVPAVHDRDVVADLLDLGHVVGAEQHGQPAGGQPLDQRPHVADAGGVEAVGGLVEHQQPGLAQQAGRDAEALAHAVGVAADLAVGPVGQVDDLQDLLEQPGPDAAVEEREALEVLPAGQVGVEAGALDEAGDAVQHADAGVGPGLVEDPDRAGVGPDQAEEHPQERRLAGAVGPEDPVDLARGHADGDVVDGADRPEGLGHAHGVDGQWLCHAADGRSPTVKRP